MLDAWARYPRGFAWRSLDCGDPIGKRQSTQHHRQPPQRRKFKVSISIWPPGYWWNGRMDGWGAWEHFDGRNEMDLGREEDGLHQDSTDVDGSAG